MRSIEEVIQQTETAFNTKDLGSFVATFADDAWTVGVTGQVLHGRDEIAEVSRELFAGPLKDQLAEYVVDEVRHLSADIAIVRKLAYATDAQGNRTDVGHAMVA